MSCAIPCYRWTASAKFLSSLKPILLVEDNPKDIELTRSALETSRLANEVMVVRDGFEALDYIHRRGDYGARDLAIPAVVILGIQMPGVTGHEVVAHLRADPAMEHILIVMLTASRKEATLLRSYKDTAKAYVVKPIGFQKFSNAVQQLGVF